jgi:hypothetical protein
MTLNIAKLILMRLALAVLLVLVPFKSSQAIEQVPQAMQGAVPLEWRAPFARFLQELGATNVEAMLNGTKVGYLFNNTSLSSTVFGLTGPELTALRVETAETCSNDYDLCLTIIAQMANGEVVARAMFPAGNRINSADVITDFLGARSFPVRFYSKETITTVIQTAKGVFVKSACQPTPPL